MEHQKYEGILTTLGNTNLSSRSWDLLQLNIVWNLWKLAGNA